MTSKRSDGYHNLQTIFQLLDYCDEINIDYRDDGVINRISGNEHIPKDQDLLLRSAIILKKITESVDKAKIENIDIFYSYLITFTFVAVVVLSAVYANN